MRLKLVLPSGSTPQSSPSRYAFRAGSPTMALAMAAYFLGPIITSTGQDMHSAVVQTSVHSVSIELDLVQPVGVVWCFLDEFCELRFDPGRRRARFIHSVGPDRARTARARGFRHCGYIPGVRIFVGPLCRRSDVATHSNEMRPEPLAVPIGGTCSPVV